MSSRLRAALWIAIAIAVVALAAGGYWVWEASRRVEPPAPAAAPPPAVPVASTPQPPAASAPASAPAEAQAPSPSPEPAPTPQDLDRALAELVGSRAALALLQAQDFPRRFVATVDNLGRSHAPPLLWPVTPTEGRFTTESRDGQTVVSAQNAARYAPFMRLVDAVDTEAAVRLYRRLYPQLQQAYADIGFPGRSFHARLIEVIDLLLATPEAPEPLIVRLTEVKGPIPSTRPWVRYEFDDPALESLAAGQKILVRSGAANERLLKSKLAELRRALTRTEARR